MSRPFDDRTSVKRSAQSTVIRVWSQPRGSLGTLPWTYSLDFGAEWRPEMFEDALSVKIDVFNVLNRQGVTQIVEQAESGGSGIASPTYRVPSVFQTPRTIRLGFSYNFSL